ncbi:SymE family type I addiction module toxin [Herbaspirillum sp. RTI4]|uniref:SymE family type I addiction module toxin n=1 Tax=Herbaspirillum sp. RTI4 TaxID=3048640 RepID=UPI002AB4C48F|nr:SymE family type I addiction module toxin [Herbaspirillum sp. RTI4]MDY7576730.1 SymE family type I addiction module toxin [Herbaspirillum sp. RTI4]MDY7579911.1 SymE family type I addiction module toxin [Herbaspirillum sp. RTI4]MEA9983590.1 SymE family type I addiction module toxin [Herbaspirillum sp. RTI4]
MSNQQGPAIVIRPERHITVSSIGYAPGQPIRDPGKRVMQAVPWIRIQGKWLEQAGFAIRTPVRIRVMVGCLVLTVD